MPGNVLFGKDRQIIQIPQSSWEVHLEEAPQHGQTRLAFMTPDHQRVRYFAVRELVRGGKPLAPEEIASVLNLTLDATRAILAELEQRLFFLVRDRAGDVVWAFPVTVQPTPHRLIFSTGEQLYAA